MSSSKTGADPDKPIKRLWQAIYDRRKDLQFAYPDIRDTDRDGFLAWTTQSGLREHGIPECFAHS